MAGKKRQPGGQGPKKRRQQPPASSQWQDDEPRGGHQLCGDGKHPQNQRLDTAAPVVGPQRRSCRKGRAQQHQTVLAQRHTQDDRSEGDNQQTDGDTCPPFVLLRELGDPSRTPTGQAQKHQQPYPCGWRKRIRS